MFYSLMFIKKKKKFLEFKCECIKCWLRALAFGVVKLWIFYSIESILYQRLFRFGKKNEIFQY